jgi:hypothetical protein
MAKIESKCKEVLDKAEVVAIATSGSEGPHIAATWGEYIRKLRPAEEDILLVPVAGYRTTEQNLVANGKIELIMGTRQVEGGHGPGKGCRITGTGKIETSGKYFESAKKAFSWARGVMVITVGTAQGQL